MHSSYFYFAVLRVTGTKNNGSYSSIKDLAFFESNEVYHSSVFFLCQGKLKNSIKFVTQKLKMKRKKLRTISIPGLKLKQ